MMWDWDAGVFDFVCFFFFSSRRRHTRWNCDWSSDVCSSDLLSACEKKLKGWRRSRKVALIEHTNPRWLEWSEDWEQQPKIYDRSWETEEMVRDSSLRSE